VWLLLSLNHAPLPSQLSLQPHLVLSVNQPFTPFRIRIRENHKLSDGRVHRRVSVLFANLSIGQTTVLRHKRQLWGHWVYVAAMRLEDNSLLVVATQSKPKSAISDDDKRWSIETLFAFSRPVDFV
jgi:hypothetical protein